MDRPPKLPAGRPSAPQPEHLGPDLLEIALPRVGLAGGPREEWPMVRGAATGRISRARTAAAAGRYRARRRGAHRRPPAPDGPDGGTPMSRDASSTQRT